MNTGVAVIVQCRLSSSRLPGKALKNLGGKTVLEWTLASMRKVKADRYFIATDESSYEKLKGAAEKCGWEIFAGPLEDVLKRYCLLIEKIGCSTVVRATADNPFLFYEAAQELCDEFRKQSSFSVCDYMAWTGLPHGSGVEVFRAQSLLNAEALTDDPYDREHVGPALYNHRNNFTSQFFKAPSRFYYPDFRTTVDTPADYRRAVAVVQHLSAGQAPAEPYTTEQIMSAVKNPAVYDTVLFVPSVKKGHGTGHLRRCLAAASEAGSFVYIPEDANLADIQRLVEEALQHGLKDYQIVRRFPEQGEYSLIAADCFALDRDTAQKLYGAAPVIAIDEGSPYTRWCDYLLDVIPSFNLTRSANLAETAFIEKPANVRSAVERGLHSQLKNILVCIGGEDPEGLTAAAAAAFAASGAAVTAVVPEGKLPSGKTDNVKFVPPVQNLRERLAEYDLVVTHYGFTAFEALAAGCAVVLLATTKLHKQLAEKYGFVCLKKDELIPQKAEEILAVPEKLYMPLPVDSRNKPLGNFIKGLSHGRRFNCPVCRIFNSSADEVISRTPKRTFRRCSKCGIIYISWTADGCPKKYEKSYFDEQYKEQYGKTYLEDFDSIKKMSASRIMEINASLKIPRLSKPAVLDVGCAYGPFLAAADENGWQVFGTDIAEDAVNYVQNKLLFPAVCAHFPDFDAASEFGINRFDAVTMWYVIEHFPDLYSVLTAVSDLVKEGGVFAFSTPSGEGVSAKLNKSLFFEQSPSDHYTVWEPSRTAGILKKFGFSVAKIISTGHHPERFPSVRKNGWENGSLMFGVFSAVSRTFSMGDTFEIYCTKDKISKKGRQK